MKGKKQALFSLKLLSAFLVVFFIAASVLVSIFFLPKMEKTLKDQHAQDHRTTLEVEAELFRHFVDHYRQRMSDLAAFPSVTSAALLAQGHHSDFLDLVENFAIAGEKSRLVLQDITGHIVYQSNADLRGDFSTEAPWLPALLNGTQPYHLQILAKEAHVLRFFISVPIKYHNSVEGVLSAEVSTPMDTIFSQRSKSSSRYALSMTQGELSIQPRALNFYRPVEFKLSIPPTNITLKLIADQSALYAEISKLNQQVFFILILGLGLSFFLLLAFGYQSVRENQTASVAWIDRSYFLPMAILILGIGASVAGYKFVKNLQVQEVRELKQYTNQKRLQAVEQHLQRLVVALNGFSAFFKASETVDRLEFATYTQALLEQNPDIHSLKWAPRLPHEHREGFETLIRGEGLPGFRVKMRQDNGLLVTSTAKALYYPLHFIEPEAKNRSQLGLDLMSDSEYWPTLERAMSTGSVSTSQTVTLNHRSRDAVGAVMAMPIYHDNNQNSAAHQENLRGFVLLSLRFEKLIDNALSNVGGDANLIIEDIRGDDKNTLFGEFPATDMNIDITSRTLDFTNRQWKISVFSTNDTLGIIMTWVPTAILLSGMLFTSMFGSAFFYLINRRRMIESIVEKRTHEIQQAKQFQDLIMNSIPDFLFVKDSEFRIVEANNTFLNLYPEHMRYHIYGTTTFENYTKEEAEGFLRNDKQALEHGYSETEESVTLPNGDRRTLLTKKTRFTDTNNNTFILGIARDITTLKEAETEILESNMELERFAYVASHDLQEPLRMVTSFTDLLERKYASKLDDTAKEYIRFASDGAKRMQELVSDLLEYARIGEEAESYATVDMLDILEEVKENLRDSIISSGATITHGPLPTLNANPIRMMCLMQNIIGNAIKYRNKNQGTDIHVYSEIHKSTAKHARREPAEWVIAIKDNGIGMKAEYCEKVFEPFKRLHAKNEYSGTGMGLAICRRIIEGYDGKIWVNSIPGDGSTFFFTIPVTNRL